VNYTDVGFNLSFIFFKLILQIVVSGWILVKEADARGLAKGFGTTNLDLF